MKKIFITKRIVKLSQKCCKKDFSFKAIEEEFGVFSTKAKAEKHIKNCVKDFSDAGDICSIVGFFIEERILDYDLDNKNGTWYPTTNSVWSYLRNGDLFSYSLFTSDWKTKCYRGTPKDAIKFKVGDFAWLFNNKKIILVKIIELPFTREKWIDIIEKKNGHEVWSDSSDDCYLAISLIGHVHPATETLFPFNREIPNDIIDKFNQCEKKFANGDFS